MICPWHGACFNVCTGDIEDSPGLDSLYKYKAEQKDGKIIISAPESELKSKVGRVIPKARKPVAATESETTVIVGGGGGGIHAIESLREHNYAGKIVLISKEDVTPYDRPKVSKGLIDDAKKIEWRSPDVLKGDFGVDLKLSTEVTGVNTQAQTVSTKSGENIKYDKLILAPGAFAKRLPIEGKDLPGVVTIRTPDDMKPVVEALGPEAEIVIIGTSFIGMEAAGAIIAKKPKNLNVVGVDEVPFEAVLNKELGKAIVADLAGKGVKFHLGANVKKITKDGSKLQLHAEGIEPLPADVIIMGTGVGPATSFLKDSGFQLEKDGGVTVDDKLRVKGQKNVFAVGDIAHYPQHPDGNVRRVEHWNVAGNHARAVAATIAGKETAYELVPIFWSSVGKGLRYVSTGVPHDEEWLDGDSAALKFVLYQAKGGKVQTVASMGRDPYVAKASDLIQKGRMPTLDEIKKGKVSLDHWVQLTISGHPRDPGVSCVQQYRREMYP